MILQHQVDCQLKQAALQHTTEIKEETYHLLVLKLGSQQLLILINDLLIKEETLCKLEKLNSTRK